MIAGAELSVGAAGAAAADSALLLEDHGGAEEEVGARRKPLPRRKPVQWEKLENKEVVLENRKLRGDLHRLELEIAALRTQVDRQMEFKDQELTDAHKQLAAHRGQPSSAALTAERADALAAEAHGTGGVVGRVAAAADEAWVQDRVELNEDLRLYASLGDMGAVWHALRRGADINEVDDEGNTALLVAVRKNQSEVVGELLKKGADFSVANRFNQNAMSLAVKSGFTKCIQLLKDRGCPLRDPSGYSALFEATRLGKIEVVDLLLQDPAVMVDEVNILAETPLVVSATLPDPWPQLSPTAFDPLASV